MQTFEEWASSKGIVLFVSPDNSNIFSFYVSQGKETLQIVLEDKDNLVKVDVWSVETLNDEEIHLQEDIVRKDLAASLDRLLERICNWFKTRHF